jgi:hypothetical protein
MTHDTTKEVGYQASPGIGPKAQGNLGKARGGIKCTNLDKTCMHIPRPTALAGAPPTNRRNRDWHSRRSRSLHRVTGQPVPGHPLPSGVGTMQREEEQGVRPPEAGEGGLPRRIRMGVCRKLDGAIPCRGKGHIPRIQGRVRQRRDLGGQIMIREATEHVPPEAPPDGHM